MLQRILPVIKLGYPIDFSIKVSTCRGAFNFMIEDFDFIYFEFSKELVESFMIDCVRAPLHKRPKFFNLTPLPIKDREELLEFLTKSYSYTEFDVFFHEEESFFKFSFLKFLISLPKKRIVLDNGKVIEVDFYKKSVTLKEGGKQRKLYLSTTEAEILKELILAWEENKKYVKEFRAEEVSSEGSLTVLLSRLRKKLNLLIKDPVFSIKKDRKRGYFLTQPA